MEGRIYFEYRWVLKPVLIYALCHTKPIFDFDYKNKRSTPWTIRYVIRYFSFNMLRRRPAMHIEGFNMHALEGAIHIAISISFVAVAAISIDKSNICLTSPAICIVLTIRWSMSKAIHIAVHSIATLCASMHITPINMIVFNTFNTYCHIRCIA